jgi:hypothetical protein
VFITSRNNSSRKFLTEKIAIRSGMTKIFAARQAYVTMTQLSYLMFHIHSIPLTTGQRWFQVNAVKT